MFNILHAQTPNSTDSRWAGVDTDKHNTNLAQLHSQKASWAQGSHLVLVPAWDPKNKDFAAHIVGGLAISGLAVTRCLALQNLHVIFLYHNVLIGSWERAAGIHTPHSLV